ncbi:MAG: restriction endonuclease subunit S [Desulfobacteraceae bacterium]|nr:restriction endonuclease subunit S [Desulfobacteraceae bacterium]
MEKIKIKDVAKVGAGQGAPKKSSDFSSEGIPFIRAGSLEKLLSGSDEYSLEKIKEDVAKRYRLKIYSPGTVVFAKSGMSATKDRIYKLKNNCYVVNHLAALEPKNNINPDYLLLSLRRPHPSRLIKDLAYPSINQKSIESFKISVPEKYDDQIRIVTLLSRAEELIAKRKESIRLMEDLLKSVFLEFFGDPFFNKKKWPEKKLRNLCDFITKGTTPKKIDIYQEDKNDYVPFLKVYNIMDDGSINFSYKPSFVDNRLHNGFLNRSKVYPDDVLMNIVGPPLGKIGIVPNEHSEWNVNQAIAIFRCKGRLEPRFLLYTLKSKNLLNSVIKQASGIRQLNLSLEQCRNIIIPVPPISLQTRFTKIVEKVEFIKTKYRSSLQKLENLYGSLSQRAFRGELDLSKVPVNHELEVHDVVSSTHVTSPTLSVEKTEKFDLSFKTIKELIAQKLPAQFTFEMFWEQVNEALLDTETHEDEEAMEEQGLQHYEAVQKIVYKMLNGSKPFLKQIFNKESKEIVLELAR